MGTLLAPTPLLDADDPAVAARLAPLLAHRRRDRHWTRHHLARLSAGAWSARDLKAVESGRFPLSNAALSELAALYEVDVTSILPQRTPVVVDDGLVSIGGLAATFDIGDTDSLLRAFLLLVRRVRGQERAAVVDLRRSDVEILAASLGLPGETVVERLGQLMGVTAHQRRAMALMFTTGVAVIVLTAGVVGNSALRLHGGPAGHQVSPTEQAVAGGLASDLEAPIVMTPAAPALPPLDAQSASPAIEAGVVTDLGGAAVDPGAPGGRLPVAEPIASAPTVAPASPASAVTPDAGVETPGAAPSAAPAGPDVAVDEPPVPITPAVAVDEPPVPRPVSVDIATPPVPQAPQVDIATPPVPQAPQVDIATPAAGA